MEYDMARASQQTVADTEREPGGGEAEEEEEQFGEGDEKGIVEYDTPLEEQERPPILPEGNYRAEIIEAPVTESKSTPGSKYWRVGFRIDPDQYPVDFEGDEDGETLYYRRLSTATKPKARWRVRKFCEAIGAPMGKRINSNDWIGRVAMVTVAHGEFEDEPQAEIRSVAAA